MPRLAARLRIKSGRGFIKEQDRRIMHERSRNLQSLSHSPRIDSRLFVRAVDKLEPRQQLFRALFSNSLRNAEVFRVEQQVLAAGEAAVEIIHLRHYADSAFHFDRLAS